MNDRRLMVVTWLDHFSRNGWRSVEDVDLEPMEVVSIGWVTGEDDVMLCLVNEVSDGGQAGYAISILQSCIVDRYEVVF